VNGPTLYSSVADSVNLDQLTKTAFIIIIIISLPYFQDLYGLLFLLTFQCSLMPEGIQLSAVMYFSQFNSITLLKLSLYVYLYPDYEKVFGFVWRLHISYLGHRKVDAVPGIAA